MCTVLGRRGSHARHGRPELKFFPLDGSLRGGRVARRPCRHVLWCPHAKPPETSRAAMDLLTLLFTVFVGILGGYFIGRSQCMFLGSAIPQYLEPPPTPHLDSPPRPRVFVLHHVSAHRSRRSRKRRPSQCHQYKCSCLGTSRTFCRRFPSRFPRSCCRLHGRHCRRCRERRRRASPALVLRDVNHLGRLWRRRRRRRAARAHVCE